MGKHDHGPQMTRYEFKPAPNTRISRIIRLDKEIAFALGVQGVRIVAPVPGKNCIGIDVPNHERMTVSLRSLLDTEAFRNAASPWTVALGLGLAGKEYFADLSRIPHLLIAGETGSGKSVCIHSMIMSLLCKTTPDELRFLLVDPKAVEFSVYQGMPHLLAPVITEPGKANTALHWAAREMLARYALFVEKHVRSIDQYNQQNAEENKAMPRIVIVIDELADLMIVTPRETEEAICRIAQLGRAAGIHLIISTQRPTVKVITGVIKANIPTRIAFKVATGIDSRLILDQVGAETLQSAGDMLYFPMESHDPIRIQGCYLSGSAVEATVAFIRQQYEATSGREEPVAEWQ